MSGHAQVVNYMFSDDISAAFRARGWVRGAGGDLYFNGKRSSTHPHLHLRINGHRTVLVGRDIRLAVRMLAWSDGNQGRGGGGWTYIREGEVVDANWERNRPVVPDAVESEFYWILEYFTSG